MKSINVGASSPALRGKAGIKRRRLKLYSLHWQQLNGKQQSRRRRSLTVLDQMRDGASFSAACRLQRLSRNTARRYLNGALYRKGNRIKSRKVDHLFRNMEIHSHSKTLFVELSSSIEATKVSNYHKAIRIYLESGNYVPLLNLKGQGVTDSASIFYPFETNLKVIVELAEKQEDAEFRDIYEGV